MRERFFNQVYISSLLNPPVIAVKIPLTGSLRSPIRDSLVASLLAQSPQREPFHKYSRTWSSVLLTSGRETSDPGKFKNIGLPVELHMPCFQMNDQ